MTFALNKTMGHWYVRVLGSKLMLNFSQKLDNFSQLGHTSLFTTLVNLLPPKAQARVASDNAKLYIITEVTNAQSDIPKQRWPSLEMVKMGV